MKSKKNAFTLIELLAIIVILAIIAVITVPIILNIIENSRMGAATDSAYGYKDSINKYYVSELSENHELTLSGEYTVTNGVLNGSGIVNKEIPVSGDKPSEGELHYSNNELKGGCLVIGDYAVIFEGENVTKTEKGDCSEYDFVDSENNCPGSNCIYAYYTDTYAIVDSDFANNYHANTKFSDSLFTTKDYSQLLINGNQRNYFLGHILDSNGNIKKGFTCGIENGKIFCLEGHDKTKYNSNINIIHTAYSEYNEYWEEVGNNNLWFYGTNLNGQTTSLGGVTIFKNDTDNQCYVNANGAIACQEEF